MVQIIIYVCLIIILIWMLFISIRNSRQKQRQVNYSAHISTDFIISKQVDLGKNEIIAIDNLNKKIAFIKSNSIVYCKFQDINKYEIIEDENSVVKGTAGKTLVGGMFFGLGGAMIGANSKRKIDQHCSKLSILIYTSDINNTLISYSLIDGSLQKSSNLYKEAVLKAKEICSLLEFAINNKELNDSLKINDSKKKDTAELKKELNKLKEMFDAGLITESEYEEKRKQILGL